MQRFDSGALYSITFITNWIIYRRGLSARWLIDETSSYVRFEQTSDSLVMIASSSNVYFGNCLSLKSSNRPCFTLGIEKIASSNSSKTLDLHTGFSTTKLLTGTPPDSVYTRS